MSEKILEQYGRVTIYTEPNHPSPIYHVDGSIEPIILQINSILFLGSLLPTINRLHLSLIDSFSTVRLFGEYEETSIPRGTQIDFTFGKYF